jgi:hypothetical protein
MPLALLLLLLIQAPAPGASGLNQVEQSKYNLETQSRDRLELLEEVVARYRKTFEDFSRKKDLDGLLVAAEDYSEALKLVQSEASKIPEEQRRKSRPLRKVEIELRKTRDDLQDFMQSASAEQQDGFDRFVRQTETVRVGILQLIFGKDALKDK